VWEAAFGLLCLFGCGGRSPLGASSGAVRDAQVDDAGVREAGPARCVGVFRAPVLVAGLNTPFDDLCARLSPDERTVYFTSDRGDPRPRPAGWNLWVATRASAGDAFANAHELASLESDAEDACPTVTANGLDLYFQTRRGRGSLEIWSATRADPASDFGVPEKVTTLTPDGWTTWNPYVVPDGSAIWLTAQSAGQTYLHRAVAFVNGFTMPAPALELSSDAQTPVVTLDELTIFFSRPAAARSFDIRTATRPTRGASFEPDALSELSTPDYEFPSWISPDGCRLYFTAEWTRGAGRDDVWMAERGD
jgi:hypothetical protein